MVNAQNFRLGQAFGSISAPSRHRERRTRNLDGENGMALRCAFRLLPALLLLPLATACVPQPAAAPMTGSLAKASLSGEIAAPSNTTTYTCADGGMMRIQNMGTSLRLLGPDGIEAELPASPANQTSRYGEAHDAILIDGQEALIMKAGQRPLTCTR
jgi:hypothetical protein